MNLNLLFKIIFVIFSYLLGSIPNAFFIYKIYKGGDIRPVSYTHLDVYKRQAFRIRYLLNRKHVSEKMGKLAKEYVLNNFLITRHLRDYLSIMIALENENKYIIQI